MAIFSLSRWESSYFGGFYRVITDYPRVKIDDRIRFEHGDMKSSISFYQREKILQIFLSKVTSNNLIDLFLMNNEVTEQPAMFGGGSFTRLTVDSASLSNVFSKIYTKEKELKSLLKEYEGFITSSVFYFDIPKGQSKSPTKRDPGGDKGKDSKEKNGKGKDTKEKERRRKERASANVKFREAMEDIKESTSEYVLSSLSNFNKKIEVIIRAENKRSTIAYSKSEVLFSDLLQKKLDVSFDPVSDTVKSLRLGKLDISKIAEAQAGNNAIYYQKVEEQNTRPFSVCILCDESGSMGREKMDAQISMVRILYRTFSQILPQDKLFIYGHSGGSSPELYVYHDPHSPCFEGTIHHMGQSMQQNYDGPIIEAVHKRVRDMTSDKIIFLVLSDGSPSGSGYGSEKDIEDLKKIVEMCRRDGFVAGGIGILYEGQKDLYKNNVLVKNLDEMPKKVSQLVNHIVKTEFQ